MSALALITIMSMYGCAHHHPCAVSYENPWLSHRTIEIYDCKHETQLIALYADGKTTIPMANPFVADSKGRFTFFTTKQCVDIAFLLTKEESKVSGDNTMSTHPLTLQRLTEMKEQFDERFPPSIFAKGADMSPATWHALKNLIPAYSFDGKSEHAYFYISGPWIDIHIVPEIPFGQIEPCRCEERANGNVPSNVV